MKKDIKDFANNIIEVGDQVVFTAPYYKELTFGYIDSFTKSGKSARIISVEKVHSPSPGITTPTYRILKYNHGEPLQRIKLKGNEPIEYIKKIDEYNTKIEALEKLKYNDTESERSYRLRNLR